MGGTAMKKTYSLSHKKYLSKLRTQSFFVHFFRILLLAVLLGLWELIAHLNIVDPFLISSPSRIVKTFIDLISSGTLFNHTLVTLYETALAFLISTVLGAIIAIVLYLIPAVRRVLEPYLVILNSLPKIALGPLIIVWVGIGTKAIVTMGILICIVITTISLLNGYLEVEEEKRKLLKTMGANKMQELFHLIIPATLPNFISVLKINVGMSWVGVIMGEYLSSKAGLGYLIVYGGQVFKLDLVMTAIVVLCVLAGIMYGLIAALEKYINKKRNL